MRTILGDRQRRKSAQEDKDLQARDLEPNLDYENLSACSVNSLVFWHGWREASALFLAQLCSTSTVVSQWFKNRFWKMYTWLQLDESQKCLAFLAPVPIERAIRQSTTSISNVQGHTHSGTSTLFTRRAISIPPSQGSNRVSPCLAISMAFSEHASSAILLVDHGSRRAVANDMLSDVRAMVQKKTDLPIYTAHMELASPTITEGVNKCVSGGATHIIVVPFFLSPGRHVTTDIPKLTAEAVANHPGVTYNVRPPIGTHPGIIDVILDQAGLLGSVQN